MSTNGYPLTPAVPEHDIFDLAGRHTRPQHRYWLHALLLLLTLLTTTVVGAGLAESFAQKAPFDLDAGITGYTRLLHDPSFLLEGLPFSLTLLAILLAHEFGHYFAARYYFVDATLPFFLPAPTLIGTMGAFIRIRSPILSKRVLFDIGIAGPLAGFALLVWPLAAGVGLSTVAPGIAHHGDLIFGTPVILRLFEWVQFPGVPVTDILLHPMARAAWAGLLATSINLLPIGQLDGGHILYAFLGERTKLLSRIFAAALIPMGFFFAYMWLVWAAVLFLFGMRHPAIVDPAPLSPARKWLGFFALVVLILCFSPSPVRTAAQ
ncbi:MAG TPA: site-2 protease family protein [Bryobacteraceae bacterium]